MLARDMSRFTEAWTTALCLTLQQASIPAPLDLSSEDLSLTAL